MHHLFKKLLPSLAVALTVTSSSAPMPAHAQTYPIDCAILLCLSGGWPASVPCARARAEFIRRITPWPIEPPLQIWRCPMGATYEFKPQQSTTNRIYDAWFQTTVIRPGQSIPTTPPMTVEAIWHRGGNAAQDTVPHLVQDRADIDISGPEFNFVRSIRVFDILIDDDRHDGDCSRNARIRLGSYGVQGDFRWNQSSRMAIPAEFGPTRSGCSLRVRAVFVEWRDYQGNYGSERIDY